MFKKRKSLYEFTSCLFYSISLFLKQLLGSGRFVMINQIKQAEKAKDNFLVELFAIRTP